MSFVSTCIHDLTYISRFYNGGVREKDFLTQVCLKLIRHVNSIHKVHPILCHGNWTEILHDRFVWMEDYVIKYLVTTYM